MELMGKSCRNVLIDLSLNEHDENHLEASERHIIITNSDCRDSERILLFTGAKMLGTFGEKKMPFYCDDLERREIILNNIEVFCIEGSKTPGELAILIDKTTLVTGDIIRSHEGGRLCMLLTKSFKTENLLKFNKRIAAVV